MTEHVLYAFEMEMLRTVYGPMGAGAVVGMGKFLVFTKI